MKQMKWEIKSFRSHGFVNRSDNMGRVYVDLPINEAKKLCRDLNNPTQPKIKVTLPVNCFHCEAGGMSCSYGYGSKGCLRMHTESE